MITVDDIVRWANVGENKSKRQQKIRDKIHLFLKEINFDLTQKIESGALLKAYEAYLVEHDQSSLKKLSSL